MHKETNWKSNIALFMTGQGITLFGSMMVHYAIIWHITLKTQSGVMMTMLAVAGALPIFFISPFGGVWADRYKKNKINVIAVILFLLTTLILPGCKGGKSVSVFTGTVLEPGEASLLLEPDEGSWVRNSSDKVSVSIKDARLLDRNGNNIEADQIKTGAKVQVSFDGEIAESYPAQIFDCFEVKVLGGGSSKAAYKKITAEQAKNMMEEEPYILLDVRTDEEFREKRIEGAILIPDYEIKERAAAELPDKNALILVYCRSGVRSSNAANELVDMGYTNVYDFGGIIDWPYETVSD